MAYCPNCGEEVDEDDEFCSNCGEELNNEESELDRDKNNGEKDSSTSASNSNQEHEWVSRRGLLAGSLVLVLLIGAASTSDLFGPTDEEIKDQIADSVEVKDVGWEYVGIANQDGSPYGNVQAKVTNSYDESVTLSYRYEKLYDSSSELYGTKEITLDRWETKTLNMTADGTEIELKIESGDYSTEKTIDVGEPSINGVEWTLDGGATVSGIDDPKFVQTKMTNKGPKRLFIRLSGSVSADGDAMDRSSRVGLEASPGVWTEEGYDYRESSFSLGPYETKEIPIRIEWTSYGTSYPSQDVDLSFWYRYHNFRENSEITVNVEP